MVANVHNVLKEIPKGHLLMKRNQLTKLSLPKSLSQLKKLSQPKSQSQLMKQNQLMKQSLLSSNRLGWIDAKKDFSVLGKSFFHFTSGVGW